MVFSTFLFLYFYVQSVTPAGQEKVIGERAYRLCGRYRVAAIIFEFISAASYVVYFYHPLPVPLPRFFPWGWNTSTLAGVLLGAPSMCIMVKGMRDAGSEAIAPMKGQPMFGGVYEHVRHPQAAGEMLLRIVMGLMLNSPFLTLFSLVDIPVYNIMCRAEEQDLLLRFGDDYAEYMKRTRMFIPAGWLPGES